MKRTSRRGINAAGWMAGTSFHSNAAALPAAEPEVLDALRYLARRFDGIDSSGYCKLCGAARKYVAPNKEQTQPCENRTCKSHLIVAAISKAEGRS